MRQTKTYERLSALLLVSGTPVDRVEQLQLRALGIATERRSSVLGYRHLLMAAGVWDEAVPAAEAPKGSAGVAALAAGPSPAGLTD